MRAQVQEITPDMLAKLLAGRDREPVTPEQQVAMMREALTRNTETILRGCGNSCEPAEHALAAYIRETFDGWRALPERVQEPFLRAMASMGVHTGEGTHGGVVRVLTGDFLRDMLQLAAVLTTVYGDTMAPVEAPGAPRIDAEAEERRRRGRTAYL